MQKKENFLPFFLVFFTISAAIILLGKSGVLNGFLSVFGAPISVGAKISQIFSFKGFINQQITELSKENANLKKQILDKNNLVLENKALSDQFAKSGNNSTNLLPAKIVGSPGFIPGVSLPQFLVIDKGKRDGVKIGSVIVSSNNLVGTTIEVADNFSKVELLNSVRSSFTAKILSDEQVYGVIKGKGNENMILENVLLSQNLKKDQIVVTRGETNTNGSGMSADLIVGKIISVEKKSSDLFQKAEVRSFVDFVNLDLVFVLR